MDETVRAEQRRRVEQARQQIADEREARRQQAEAEAERFALEAGIISGEPDPPPRVQQSTAELIAQHGGDAGLKLAWAQHNNKIGVTDYASLHASRGLHVVGVAWREQPDRPAVPQRQPDTRPSRFVRESIEDGFTPI